MNETGLIILLAAGVIALAATVWFAVRSPRQMHAQALATAASQIPLPVIDEEIVPPAQPKQRRSAPPEPEMPQTTEHFAPPAPTLPAAIPVPVPPPTSEKDAQNVLFLLKQAYQQLTHRQQRIESELARIEMLRGEHEAVATQVAALDLAMKAFNGSSSADYRQAAPHMLAEFAPALAAQQAVAGSRG